MIDRPKPRRHAEVLDAAERRMIDALPGIIEGLVMRAKEGVVEAAVT